MEGEGLVWNPGRKDYCLKDLEKKLLSYNEGKSENQGGIWMQGENQCSKYVMMSNQTETKNEIVNIQCDLPLYPETPNISTGKNKGCFVL